MVCGGGATGSGLFMGLLKRRLCTVGACTGQITDAIAVMNPRDGILLLMAAIRTKTGSVLRTRIVKRAHLNHDSTPVLIKTPQEPGPMARDKQQSGCQARTRIINFIAKETIGGAIYSAIKDSSGAICSAVIYHKISTSPVNEAYIHQRPRISDSFRS